MALRKGQEFIDSLKDNRKVFVDGELVRDVTTYGPFRGIIQTIADLHDAQFDPKFQDIMTYIVPETQERACRTYLAASDWDGMKLLMRSMYLRCQLTYGLLGRLSDFVSALLADQIEAFEFVGASDAVARTRWYRDYARDNDLVIAHALIDPQTDRSKPNAPIETVRLVERREDGIVVSGARLLSTLAPVANEIYIGPYVPRKPEEADRALIFSTPAATKGLKIVCRESYARERSEFDRPLSGRFDEGDAILIFDEVLVPHERVIVAGDVETYNALMRHMPGYMQLQAVIRSTAKLRLLTGIASIAAKVTGRNKSPRYQEMLGELVAQVTLAEGLQLGAAGEVLAQLDAHKQGKELATGELGEPAIQARIGSTAITTFFPRAARQAFDTIRSMAGSGALAFTEADYQNPELQPLLDRFLHGPKVSAMRRLQVMKLVWEITGEQFGSRQALYEQYYAGDGISNLVRFASFPTKRESEELAAKLLGWKSVDEGLQS